MTSDPAAPAPERPTRVVMLVDNRVVGDSRVIKSARTAALAGYDVVVLGLGAPSELTLGGIRVILRPGLVPPAAQGSVQQLLRRVIGEEAAIARRRALLDGRTARRTARALRLGDGRPPAVRALTSAVSEGVRLSGGLARKAQSARIRAARLAAAPPSRLPLVGPLVARRASVDPDAWVQLDPLPQRMSDGWAAALDELAPDLIHAHDYRTLPAAIAARQRARAAGRTPAVVYDAHEWVQGYDELGPERHEAAMRIERTLIHEADVAITVDPNIAALIETSYGLGPMPVVLNAPEAPPGPTPGPRLRERLRLSPTDPLVVYAGSVGKSRSLQMCVEALPRLPGVHLALVVGQPDSAVMLELLDRAVEVGVRDRVHVTRYVAQEYVVDFVRDADVGITPNRHNPNTENSLPTKAREYLLAEVPQVVSDVRTLAAFIRDHGLGEVFVADDTDSFAEAVRTVLADLERYRSAVTDELRRAHSWDAQGDVLAGVYACLRPPTPGLALPLAAAEHQPASASATRLLPPPAHATSLVIGPANSAGQGYAWAQAAARIADVDALNVAMDLEAPFTFPAARLIATSERTDPDWVRALDAEVAETRTHVLLESGSTLSGSSLETVQVATEVGAFEAAGLRVGLVMHGSEIRSPRRHAELHPTSPFPTADPDWVQTLQKRADRTLSLAEWLGVPVFVSTPDLLDHIPWATWLPVSVDPDLHTSSAPVLAQERPVVLHAPSNSALKGSHIIDEVLSRLDEEGLVSYTRLAGRSRAETAAAIRTADIVVDQLGMGLYGVLACEAMAAGRVVLAEVGDTVRSRIPGGAAPILEINAATLEGELRRLVGTDREAARAAAGAGPDFVRTHHDGRAAARVLSAFLGQTVD